MDQPLSFKLSQAAELYIGYIVTVAQADGGGTVLCNPNQFPTLNSKQRVALDTTQVNLDKVCFRRAPGSMNAKFPSDSSRPCG